MTPFTTFLVASFVSFDEKTCEAEEQSGAEKEE
jgi:hypothetical protein